MMRPLESSITRRRMRSTIAESWVATMTVVPVRLMRYSSCMIPIEVSGSRLPVGEVVQLGRQPREAQDVRHLGADLLARAAGHLERVGDVVVHRAVGQQLEVLEDDPEVAPEEGHLL